MSTVFSLKLRNVLKGGVKKLFFMLKTIFLFLILKIHNLSPGIFWYESGVNNVYFRHLVSTNLKLGKRLMYQVYRNQAAGAYSCLNFLHFLSLQFANI